ncbi:MAG: type II toxin-antitoxin system prevent-host-death family antitoxin [Thermomicrobiales bacterium]|nr:type II toxin-antitoxin system prevent-host-death family antitoxin [Thermomicrobiales bacterium]
MQKVGVRDLKIHASEIVRRMREEGESFEITYRGETVGRILPAEARGSQAKREASFRRWLDFADEIDKERTDSVSAEETMREIRRDL